MAALTAERNTRKMEDVVRSPLAFPVKAATKIYKGSLVCINAGYAQPGATATGLGTVGRAKKTIDNSAGANGDLTIEVDPGIFKWNNSGGDLVVAADVDGLCYVTDDNTVCHTATGKSVAGRVMQLDTDGVWVQSGVGLS